MNECFKCGASIDALKECLREPKGTENHDIARSIIDNCPECREAMDETRVLTLLGRLDGGKSVALSPEEIAELIPRGLTVDYFGNGRYSRNVPLTPENKAILEKAGYSFREPML